MTLEGVPETPEVSSDRTRLQQVLNILAGLPPQSTDHISAVLRDQVARQIHVCLVREDPRTLLTLEKPDESVVIAAVEQDPDICLLLPSPTNRILLAAVRKKPQLIGQLKEPATNLQLTAVRSDPNVLSLITNPCDEAVRLAEKLKRQATE